MAKEARRLAGPTKACDLAESLSVDARHSGAERNHPSRPSGASDLDAVLRLLHGPEPDIERATVFVAALGDRWIENCPTLPEKIARLHLAGLGRQSRWDQAVAWVGTLEREGLPWAQDLAAMVGVGHALSLWVSGQRDRAMTHLTRLAQPGR